MTTTDLWITDLSGGPSLGQHGGGVSPAGYVSDVLLDFIRSGKATAKPGHAHPADLELDISGHLLIEVFAETERRTGQALIEGDGRRSIECVAPDHLYHAVYLDV